VRVGRLVPLLPVVLLFAVTASSAVADSERNFVTHLSGGNEIPAVETQARGQAVFHLSKDGTELQYRLMVANIENVTQAHIHCGAEDVNGPVVAFLYGFGPTVSPNGILAQGTLAADDVIPRPDSLACPGGVANVSDMIEKIRSGDAYVNVHTVQNPAGEIRGQLP
jgi:hypothetical protein